GTGLGLPIVKAIVEGHGGAITVQSVTGEGTVFRIELPLARAPVAA
ncbi:MAG: ATP-binding protein, partial [Gaiellaceae bacterium]